MPKVDSAGTRNAAITIPISPIPSLDGLRCVAILPVFFSHTFIEARVPNPVPGNFGVTLFFFLSGYLITTLMRLEHQKTGTVSLILFYLRRALRILPAFYVVLALAALRGWYAGTMQPEWLLGQALHLTNFEIIHGGWHAPIAPDTHVYWSLAVEEHFYLVFPCLFLLLARLDSNLRRAQLLIGICACAFLWRCWLIYGLHAFYDRTYVGTDTRMDSILFGCVLALWGNPVLDPTRFSDRTWQRLLLPLAVIGIVASFAFDDRAFRETFGYTIQGVCLFAIFITAIRYPEWGPMRLLNRPPVRWIGVLSYAIYLIHPSILAMTTQFFGRRSLTLLLPVGMITTLTIAAAINYGIERPLGRLRKRLSVVERGQS